MARKRLGEVLLEEGLIDETDLKEALEYKEKSGYRLGTSLVALRIIAEWQLTEALGKALGLPVVDLAQQHPTPAALKRIPARLAERFDLIPLRLDGRGKGRELVLAMSDPLNRPVILRMEGVAGFPVRPVLASLTAIQRAIREHYHRTNPSEVLGPAGDSLASESGLALNLASEESGRQLTLTHLRRELEAYGRATPGSLPPPPVGRPPEPTLALDLKFRALLHLLLRKNLLTEREYAEALRHMIDSLAPRPARNRPANRS